MPLTKTDANGNEIYITDPNGNEITQGGKIVAGILLILVTLSTMTAIIAHWPDKLPPVDQKASTKYHYKWFAVTYTGQGGVNTGDTVIKITKSKLMRDSTTTQQTIDTVMQAQLPKPDKASGGCLIDLNTLLLLLVALAGFLGNMIHVGASFIDYVGSGKFKRSWMLWYFVKPFTASALALGVYIVFRAGFLNSNEATISVNLYGITAIAILTGLYTDRATLKLKEVFEVIFQTKNKRPDALTNPTVTSISPIAFIVGTAAQVTITGTALNTTAIKVSVTDGTNTNIIADADLAKTENTVTFSFTPAAAGNFNIVVEANNTTLKSQAITVA